MIKKVKENVIINENQRSEKLQKATKTKTNKYITTKINNMLTLGSRFSKLQNT